MALKLESHLLGHISLNECIPVTAYEILQLFLPQMCLEPVAFPKTSPPASHWLWELPCGVPGKYALL